MKWSEKKNRTKLIPLFKGILDLIISSSLVSLLKGDIFVSTTKRPGSLRVGEGAESKKQVRKLTTDRGETLPPLREGITFKSSTETALCLALGSFCWIISLYLWNCISVSWSQMTIYLKKTDSYLFLLLILQIIIDYLQYVLGTMKLLEVEKCKRGTTV